MQFNKLIPNLMVDEIPTTLNYYHGALGFEIVSQTNNADGDLARATVKRGDVEIMFTIEDSLEKEIPELHGEKPGGGFSLEIRMTGVDDFYNQVHHEAGVVEPLENKFDGYRQFTVEDVNGYFLTFAEKI